MARLDDGQGTTLTFSAGVTSGMKLYPKTITPPGIDGGGPNETTTLANVTYRTMAPKTLKTLTPIQMSCAYDPAVFPQVVSDAQVNQLLTLTWPDNSTYAFWGFLDKFEPGEVKGGEQPVANVTVQPSNMNGSGAETAPVFTP